MKRLLLMMAGILLSIPMIHAQPTEKEMPKGFEQVRVGIPFGKIDTIQYESETVGATRKALIYKPPGYNKKIKYPVLYLLHGGGEDQRGWATQGKTDLILDNLIAEKKAKPMIIVMLDGNMGGGGGIAGFG